MNTMKLAMKQGMDESIQGFVTQNFQAFVLGVQK